MDISMGSAFVSGRDDEIEAVHKTDIFSTALNVAILEEARLKA